MSTTVLSLDRAHEEKGGGERGHWILQGTADAYYLSSSEDVA